MGHAPKMEDWLRRGDDVADINRGERLGGGRVVHGKFGAVAGVDAREGVGCTAAGDSL
jgi:hypothetical protein